MKLLKDVFRCAVTVACFLLGIVVLDGLTGVPLSYGVPLAAVLSLLPYAFMIRREARSKDAARDVEGSDAPRRAGVSRRQGRRAPGGPQRPAVIHSIVFLPNDAGRGGASRPAAAAPTAQQV